MNYEKKWEPSELAKRTRIEKGKNMLPKCVNTAKLKCFNCDKRGHYTRYYSKTSRKVVHKIRISELCVSNSILLDESNPFWIIHLGA